LQSYPLTTHALSWSCDAELAIAADDSVYIYVPDYPTTDEESKNQVPRPLGPGELEENGKQRQQYYSKVFRFCTIKKADPRLNHDLFHAVGLKPPPEKPVDSDPFYTVGSGIVTGYGSSLSQVVAIGWSPGGIGHNLRPIISVLFTSGALITYGENPSKGDSINLGSSTRTFDSWRLLWGLGSLYPLPDASAKEKHITHYDRVTSFSWAKAIAPGIGLLAYSNDCGEVIVVSTQRFATPANSDHLSNAEMVWRVDEVARFDGSGPHTKTSVRKIAKARREKESGEN
jgi:hypothetical protein